MKGNAGVPGLPGVDGLQGPKGDRGKLTMLIIKKSYFACRYQSKQSLLNLRKILFYFLALGLFHWFKGCMYKSDCFEPNSCSKSLDCRFRSCFL